MVSGNLLLAPLQVKGVDQSQIRNEKQGNNQCDCRGLGPKGGLNNTLDQHFSAPKAPKFFEKIEAFGTKMALSYSF